MLTETAHIDTLLGDPAVRYFSQGFKNFDFRVESLETTDGTISGILHASYHGHVRPRSEEVHIGSIEYLSLALRLASYGLNRVGRIGIADMDRSFLCGYGIKVRQPLFLGQIPFRCSLVRGGMDMGSLQGSRSHFDVQIGPNSIALEIDHRGGGRYHRLPQRETLDIRYEQLHSLGYRYRRVQIGQVSSDPVAASISAKVSYLSLIEEDILHGIGSAREMLLPTDATQVFGQLMQALLFQIDGTDRGRCPCIWLRKMELGCERPTFDPTCPANVRFDRIRQVSRHGQQWQLVELSGTVGSYEGRFEVAHEIPAL